MMPAPRVMDEPLDPGQTFAMLMREYRDACAAARNGVDALNARAADERAARAAREKADQHLIELRARVHAISKRLMPALMKEENQPWNTCPEAFAIGVAIDHLVSALPPSAAEPAVEVRCGHGNCGKLYREHNEQYACGDARFCFDQQHDKFLQRFLDPRQPATQADASVCGKCGAPGHSLGKCPPTAATHGSAEDELPEGWRAVPGEPASTLWFQHDTGARVSGRDDHGWYWWSAISSRPGEHRARVCTSSMRKPTRDEAMAAALGEQRPKHYHGGVDINDPERMCVQLAGVAVAASGCTSGPNVVVEGDYGWSIPYQDTLSLRRKYDEAIAEIAALKTRVGQLDRALDRTMTERDEAQEWADKLAYSIGTIEEIGEHTNLNNPWAQALELSESEDECKRVSAQCGAAICKQVAEIESLKAHIAEQAAQYATLRDAHNDVLVECDALRMQNTQLRRERAEQDALLSAQYETPVARGANRGYIHEYKCHPQYFEACAQGRKSFDVRKDDRDVRPRVGETVMLCEWDPVRGAYTNSKPLERVISYVLVGDDAVLPKGWLVLGFHGPLKEADDVES